jgi:alanyl-tRNA synthetase
VVVASGIAALKAGELISEICMVLGGKGGGKPNLAQGGGPDVGKIDDALATGRELITRAG